MKKTALIVFIAAAVLTGGGAVFWGWRGHVIHKQRQRAELKVQTLLERQQGREALVLLQLMRRETAGESLPPEQETQWKKWELQAAWELRDMPRLILFYERDSGLLQQNEEASLMAARALLALRKPLEAAKLRSAWRGHETKKEDWLAYDADECLRRGKPEEARALLTTTTFAGPADCSRLLRLAILNADRPAEAVKYFNAAYAADPHNPDLRSFRAQILENAGQLELARVEYVAAQAANPANPLLRDQLAEFYLRQHDYPLAVQTLGQNLADGSFDSLWVKARFWGRVTSPLTPVSGPCPPGSLQALADLLAKLPPDRFWDEAAFSKLRQAPAYAAGRQEVYWLRLLQNLRDGREKEALEQLQENHFRAHSWNRELQSSLLIFLHYRKTKQAPQPGDFDSELKERHALFDSIASWCNGQANTELQSFAAGPYAFAGACLASGWVEAALQLVPTDRALPDAPEWFRYGLVQALRLNRSPAAALAFATKQPPTSLLRLAIGELCLAEGNRERATAELKTVAAENSDAGYRAAWLLAGDALQQRKPAEAVAFVSAQPKLAASLAGKEYIARAAMMAGDENRAVQLYRAMEKDSAEAKVFLARRAFAARQWGEARRLTLALSVQFPDELSFREALLKIDKAASAP